MRPLPEKLLLVLVSLVAFASGTASSAAAKKGGASSGGGHDLGIFALREFTVVADVVEQTKDLYTPEEKAILKARARSIRSVLIVSEELPAIGDDHAYGTHLIQKSTAFSRYDGETSEVRLNDKKFSAMADPIAIDGLLHHELAVLAGLEKTGDYRYTDRFMAFREKEWLSKRMICTASVFEKKASGSESVPGRMLGSAATPAMPFADVESGILYLENLEPAKDPSRAVARVRTLRYVSDGSGYFRATLSDVDARVFGDPARPTGVQLAGSTIDRIGEITYYNVYDWMSAGREARLRDFGDGYLMISCARL